MTLNIGHGRGTGVHQLIQTRTKIMENAEKIAETIKQNHIDISALQEVDGFSIWNKGIDFIEFLAKNSGCPHGIWSKNVDGPGLRYGTALLSDIPYSQAVSYTFKARPFILPKGFTTGLFCVSKEEENYIYVVSVHLAPLFPFIRKRQAEAIIETVKDIKCPIVIAGDFNCGYKKGSAIKLLEEKLNLKLWEPELPVGTFRTGKRRIDWIMISQELDFEDYQIIDDRVSDHSAIKAIIRYYF
ncbi:MAG: endonuclease/exonuclease/phosphatase family protein [Spirochaetales bacterium]|nr:endonuclease/exonuclease/phosphatase family protein [Spirochaetales bacterium]